MLLTHERLFIVLHALTFTFGQKCPIQPTTSIPSDRLPLIGKPLSEAAALLGVQSSLPKRPRQQAGTTTTSGWRNNEHDWQSSKPRPPSWPTFCRTTSHK